MGDRRVRVSNGNCLIKLTGEIDFANAEQLTDWLFGQIDRVSCHQVDLDFDEVSLIDSSGIRTLVLIHRHVTGKGATLRVVNPQPAVRRILETTGVDELFGI
jgi:anti-anti-sigma factor